MTEPTYTDEVQLVVLNITSWEGISLNAEHSYGNIILVNWTGIDFDNIEEFGINTFGEEVKLERVLSRKDCVKLDKKDGGTSLQKMFDLRETVMTNRFDTIDQITEEGIRYWKDSGL